MLRLLLLSALLVAYAESRNPKWFFNRGTVTSVIHRRMLVTSVVPSSCVVIDPSLPACRNVRRMDIAPSKPSKILSTDYPEMAGPRDLDLQAGEEESARASTTADGSSWAGYGWAGWGQDTVTRTVVATQTVKAVDSDAVVSIVFKGCQPTSLPFSLSTCGEESTNATTQTQRELHYTIED